LKLNDLEGAIADYNDVLVLNPAKASSLYGRGLAKLREGDSTGAAKDMNAARAIQHDIADQFAKWRVTGEP
jgi:hypothetical protein